MCEISSNLRAALNLLDAQVIGIGSDLETGSENLRSLVANRDAETQAQISHLSESVSNLKRNLSMIRQHLIKSYTASRLPHEQDPDSAALSESTDTDNLSSDVQLSPEEAEKLRHEEPVTMTSIFRSLLMANEPSQRERRNSLD